MIYDGALAADGAAGTGMWMWCLIIGALIVGMDTCRSDEPGKDQYSCDGCAVHSDAGFMQGDIYGRQRSGRDIR